jgi:hypothetical protein
MNPILEKIQNDIAEKVTDANKQGFVNAVKAGVKIMFDQNMNKQLELVKNPESRKKPVETIASGIAGLMWAMYKQSGNKMKPEVMVMAAVVLMAHAIDFCERSYDIPFDADMIAATGKLLAEKIFIKLGITQEQLQQAINQGSEEVSQYLAQGRGE